MSWGIYSHLVRKVGCGNMLIILGALEDVEVNLRISRHLCGNKIFPRCGLGLLTAHSFGLLGAR